jgi:hypothetical protein
MLPEALVLRGNKGLGHYFRNIAFRQLHHSLALGTGGQAQDLALPVQDQGAGDRLQDGRLKAGGRFQVNYPAGEHGAQKEPPNPPARVIPTPHQRPFTVSRPWGENP